MDSKGYDYRMVQYQFAIQVKMLGMAKAVPSVESQVGLAVVAAWRCQAKRWLCWGHGGRWKRCIRHDERVVWRRRAADPPMSSDRNVIWDTVHDIHIGKTARQIIFQIDQAVARTEYADACVTLRAPIAYKRHITRIAERHGVIAKNRAVHHLIG